MPHCGLSVETNTDVRSIDFRYFIDVNMNDHAFLSPVARGSDGLINGKAPSKPPLPNEVRRTVLAYATKRCPTPIWTRPLAGVFVILPSGSGIDVRATEDPPVS